MPVSVMMKTMRGIWLFIIFVGVPRTFGEYSRFPVKKMVSNHTICQIQNHIKIKTVFSLNALRSEVYIFTLRPLKTLSQCTKVLVYPGLPPKCPCLGKEQR